MTAPMALATIAPGALVVATGPGARQAALEGRIALARRHLATRLSELERRVTVVKHRVDPRTWLENPWAQVGVAAALGFALGRSRAMRPVLRAALGAAVTSLMRQTIARLDH